MIKIRIKMILIEFDGIMNGSEIYIFQHSIVYVEGVPRLADQVDRRCYRSSTIPSTTLESSNSRDRLVI